MKNKKSINEKNIEIKENLPAKNKAVRKINVWKVIVIVALVVFAIFLVGGLFKAHELRSSFDKPTREQIDFATKIALGRFQSAGTDVSAFKVRAQDRVRKTPDKRLVLQVLIYNDSTSYIYLVDLNSGKIIMHSMTEIYEKIPPPEHRFFNDFGTGRSILEPGNIRQPMR